MLTGKGVRTLVSNTNTSMATEEGEGACVTHVPNPSFVIDDCHTRAMLGLHRERERDMLAPPFLTRPQPWHTTAAAKAEEPPPVRAV